MTAAMANVRGNVHERGAETRRREQFCAPEPVFEREPQAPSTRTVTPRRAGRTLLLRKTAAEMSVMSRPTGKISINVIGIRYSGLA